MNGSFRDPWSDEPAPAPAAEVLPAIECWRCGKMVPAGTVRCAFCAAPLVREPAGSPTRPEALQADRQSQALGRVMAVFVLLLGISLIAGLIDRAEEYVSARSLPADPRKTLAEILVLEGIDTALILAAWAWIDVAWQEPRRTPLQRFRAWGLCLPLLGVALALNHGYHQLLLDWLQIIPVDRIVARDRAGLPGWAIAICLQPAVVEELFFRYLAFGALRPVMGGNAVVWVTSVMFALAHLGVPLSLPVLFVLGLLFGYARLASGGVMLPMVLHFLHNAVILAWAAKLL